MLRYDYARACSAGPQPGAVALQRRIVELFPGSRSKNPGDLFNCRNVRGSSTALSLHAEGRAFDVWPTSKAQGDDIAEWARSNADALNIQEVIWYSRIWSAVHPSAGWRSYSGANPHRDHVHIGLNWIGARSSAVGDTEGYDGGITLGAIALVVIAGIGSYYMARQLS